MQISFKDKQTRTKNNRTIVLENNTVSVYDNNGLLLNSKVFEDRLKAMIVFNTL